MTATYRRQQGSKVYTFESLADLMAKLPRSDLAMRWPEYVPSQPQSASWRK